MYGKPGAVAKTAGVPSLASPIFCEVGKYSEWVNNGALNAIRHHSTEIFKYVTGSPTEAEEVDGRMFFDENARVTLPNSDIYDTASETYRAERAKPEAQRDQSIIDEQLEIMKEERAYKRTAEAQDRADRKKKADRLTEEKNAVGLYLMACIKFKSTLYNKIDKAIEMGGIAALAEENDPRIIFQFIQEYSMPTSVAQSGTEINMRVLKIPADKISHMESISRLRDLMAEKELITGKPLSEEVLNVFLVNFFDNMDNLLRFRDESKMRGKADFSDILAAIQAAQLELMQNPAEERFYQQKFRGRMAESNTGEVKLNAVGTNHKNSKVAGPSTKGAEGPKPTPSSLPVATVVGTKTAPKTAPKAGTKYVRKCWGQWCDLKGTQHDRCESSQPKCETCGCHHPAGAKCVERKPRKNFGKGTIKSRQVSTEAFEFEGEDEYTSIRRIRSTLFESGVCATHEEIALKVSKFYEGTSGYTTDLHKEEATASSEVKKVDAPSIATRRHQTYEKRARRRQVLAGQAARAAKPLRTGHPEEVRISQIRRRRDRVHRGKRVSPVLRDFYSRRWHLWQVYATALVKSGQARPCYDKDSRSEFFAALWRIKRDRLLGYPPIHTELVDEGGFSVVNGPRLMDGSDSLLDSDIVHSDIGIEEFRAVAQTAPDIKSELLQSLNRSSAISQNFSGNFTTSDDLETNFFDLAGGPNTEVPFCQLNVVRKCLLDKYYASEILPDMCVTSSNKPDVEEMSQTEVMNVLRTLPNSGDPYCHTSDARSGLTNREKTSEVLPVMWANMSNTQEVTNMSHTEVTNESQTLQTQIHSDIPVHTNKASQESGDVADTLQELPITRVRMINTEVNDQPEENEVESSLVIIPQLPETGIRVTRKTVMISRADIVCPGTTWLRLVRQDIYDWYVGHQHHEPYMQNYCPSPPDHTHEDQGRDRGRRIHQHTVVLEPGAQPVITTQYDPVEMEEHNRIRFRFGTDFIVDGQTRCRAEIPVAVREYPQPFDDEEPLIFVLTADQQSRIHIVPTPLIDGRGRIYSEGCLCSAACLFTIDDMEFYHPGTAEPIEGENWSLYTKQIIFDQFVAHQHFNPNGPRYYELDVSQEEHTHSLGHRVPHEHDFDPRTRKIIATRYDYDMAHANQVRYGLIPEDPDSEESEDGYSEYHTENEEDETLETSVNMIKNGSKGASSPLFDAQEYCRQLDCGKVYQRPGFALSTNKFKIIEKQRRQLEKSLRSASKPIIFMIDSGVEGFSHYGRTSDLGTLPEVERSNKLVTCEMANGSITRVSQCVHPFLGNIALDNGATSNLVSVRKITEERGLIWSGSMERTDFFRASDGLFMFAAHYVKGQGYIMTHLDILIAHALESADPETTVRAVQARVATGIPVERRAASAAHVPIVMAAPTGPTQADIVNAPLSPEEIRRAELARVIHICNGHPSDEVLGRALDGNMFSVCELTSRDLINANRIGRCDACIVAKMTEPTSAHVIPPHRGRGSRIYCDISSFSQPTSGGCTVYFFGMEAGTGYLMYAGAKSKASGDAWTAAWSMCYHLNAFRWTVREFITDSESTFGTLKEPLAGKGIELMMYPPYSHCVPIERSKRVIEERIAAIECGLTYKVPPGLRGELTEHAMHMINNSPNTKSGSATPIQLITGRRAIAFTIGWGQCVFVYDNRAGQRIAEKGIVVGIRVSSVGMSLKIYLPMRHKALYRSRNVDLAGNLPDPAWGWESNSIPRSIHEDFSRAEAIGPVFPDQDNNIYTRGITYEGDDDAPNYPSFHWEQEDMQNRLQRALPQVIGHLREPLRPSIARVDGVADHEGAGEPITEGVIEPTLNDNDNEDIISVEERKDNQAEPPRPSIEPPVPDTHIEPENELVQTSGGNPEDEVIESTVPRQRKPKDKVDWSNPDPNSVALSRPRRSGRIVDYTGLGRIWSASVEMNRVILNHVTLRAALMGPHRGPSIIAIDKEIHNIITVHDSIEAIEWKKITEIERRRARRNFMFIVYKHLANGDFDKVKARWVYGATNSGNIVDDEPRDTASPTINPVTTMILLFMVAAYDLEMEVHDVPGAFLKSEMAEDAQPLYGYVGPDVTDHIKRTHPHLTTKFSPRGNLFFKLKKYIYGTNEASKRFFDTMADYLVSIGFEQSVCDPCLFVSIKGNDTMIMGVYVDDLLVLANSKSKMTWLSNQIRERWNTVYHTGNEFNYVGLHIVRNRADRSLRVDMSGNIQKLIDQFGSEAAESKVPAIESIMKQTGKPLPPVSKSLFLSLVMSILYPARMCHLAVLFATTVLATRMQAPTDDDFDQALRIIGFLKTQVQGGITIKGTPQSKLRFYVDASHSIHEDGKGHGCMIACMDDSPLAWRSYKLPHVCLSSTESEISSVSESTTYAVWATDLFKNVGHTLDEPIDIPQDNTSATLIMENGGSFKRTKHILNRYAFIKENVDRGIIRFSRCPTSEHRADLLTKVHPAPRLQELLRLVSWSSSPSEGV